MASVKDRIKALNISQVGQSPLNKPTPPPLPRSRSADNEITRPEEDGNPSSPIGNTPAMGVPQAQMPPPALPTRPEHRRPPSQSSQKPARPTLPPRGPSGLSVQRRDSSDSISSTYSATSSVSGPSTQPSNTSTSRRTSIEPKMSSTRSMAPANDPNLPPLPPPRPKETKRPPLTHTKSKSQVVSSVKPDPIPLKPASVGLSTPPTLPVRNPPVPERKLSEPSIPRPSSVGPTVTPDTQPRKSPLSFGLNKATEIAPPVPQRPSRSPAPEAGPPPIPLGSRPDLAQLQASKPKPATVNISRTATTASCLKCRDFSGPDSHAARFPRESIPSTDIGWLSHQLTDPFPSATDKARAIFTWLHHNVAYDCDAFFSGNIQPSTPGGTIASGLAVCEGYAGLFSALAMASGLESVVISGHGKGFGHQAIGPGEHIPAFNSNHAWNAVKIDGGEWKLVEPCWGAGYLSPDHKYTKHFSPQWFVVSNDEFGERHFPKDTGMFFLEAVPGRPSNPSWEEYMIGPEGAGETVTTCDTAIGKCALSGRSILPHAKQIRPNSNQTVQFRFSSVCEHYDREKMGQGKPYAFMLNTHGLDGRKAQMLPFATDGRGRHWHLDVAARELGCAGQTVSVLAVTKFDGRDGRGLTPAELGRGIGRVGMSWESVASWQLV